MSHFFTSSVLVPELGGGGGDSPPGITAQNKSSATNPLGLVGEGVSASQGRLENSKETEMSQTSTPKTCGMVQSTERVVLEFINILDGHPQTMSFFVNALCFWLLIHALGKFVHRIIKGLHQSKP